MVESIINDSLMRQIKEISLKQGISFAEACQILVEHGVTFHDSMSMFSTSSNRRQTH